MVPTDVHPLPSNAYMKLIRHDLVLAFHNAHLDRGQKPADVVDIHVTRLRFISDNTTPHFWSGFSMSANVLTHVTSTLTITNAEGRSLAVARIRPYDRDLSVFQQHIELDHLFPCRLQGMQKLRVIHNLIYFLV